MMTLDRMREKLLDAAQSLVEKKLVARTWGNISVRIDSDHFLVTPSGIPYEILLPEDLVLVTTDTLRYEGNVKPSSEKNMHAAIYRTFAGVHAVVHTHQFRASAVAAAGKSIPPVPGNNGNSKEVRCAHYALPTTKKLSRSVVQALSESGGTAVLLANHGAVCIGDSLESAIRNAGLLEDRAYSFILEEYKKVSGDVKADEDRLIDYFITRMGRKQ